MDTKNGHIQKEKHVQTIILGNHVSFRECTHQYKRYGYVLCKESLTTPKIAETCIQLIFTAYMHVNNGANIRDTLPCLETYPKCSMYGIFTYIYHNN